MKQERIENHRVSYGVFDKQYLDERLESAMIVDEKTALMEKSELDSLSEYSTTIPTGSYLGKRWKRQLFDTPRGEIPKPNGKWVLGEYAPNPDPKIVDIIWRNIEII